jgi:hypothetical protein
MLAVLTGTGLATAAGLNAFIPLVMIATLSRFTSILELSSGFAWISSWPAILVFLALLMAELVIDKIPGIDTANDFFQTPVRPAAAALAFTASITADAGLTGSLWTHHIWLAWFLGALIGIAAHLSKAASRTAISAATGGSGTATASFAEDGIAVTLCWVAFVLPWLVLPALAGIVVAVYRIVTIGRRRRQRISEKQRRWREEREAADIAAGFKNWLTKRREFRGRNSRNGKEDKNRGGARLRAMGTARARHSRRTP